MAPFGSFVDLLTEIEDPRRAEGKLYRLPHVVLFAILAIVAGQGPWRGGLPRRSIRSPTPAARSAPK